MPSEKGEDHVWVDEMDGPERLARAKKRRQEQLERWEKRKNTTSEDEKERKKEKLLKFVPNVVILEAAARNDLAEVARLLECGVSPDLANEDGLTALHQSCIDGCDDMVKYLIEHNANVNACDKELWTPLHAAAACGHMSIVEYLLKSGGNILALNLDGSFPVDLVENNDEVEKYLEQELLKLGYNVEAIEELRQNQGKQLLDDLKDSVKNGRSLDILDENGATAFHVAAAQGWTIVVDFLLENEADLEIRDNDGWQAIHAAATWGHDSVLEILVASGADLDSKTNNSETPIDLTEDDETIVLIEDLKTKQVTYPRKGKGVRRKRSNTNTSIKRSSIYEKNELSHADTKAEGAALFMQLQNAEHSETTSPEEPVGTPAQVVEVNLSEQSSNSSREETNSSGYHSEGSTKSEEKTELSKLNETADEVKDKSGSNSSDNNTKSEKDKPVQDKKEITGKEEGNSAASGDTKSSNNIKQSPVPKPPRLQTGPSFQREPKPYINLEIEPLKTTKGSSPNNGVDVTKNQESKNVKPAAENSAHKTELNTAETTVRVRTTPVLPRLVSSDKRKAPEPPEATKSAETKQTPAKENQRDSMLEKKKANRQEKRNSDSSNKKSCAIV